MSFGDSSKAWRLHASVFGACLALMLAGCLSTPEPTRPEAGRARSWSTQFEKVDWLSEWNAKRKGAWGLDNLSVQDGQGAFSHYLRAKFYKGSASPSASRRIGVKEGGGQFLSRLEGGPVDRAFLRYYLRFPEGFPFVKGGKLPGFYGGQRISGGNIPDGTNGFSTRFMWRTDGQGEVYVYMPSSPRFGTSLGRGSWYFKPGKWHCLEQELILNTPGQLDGKVRVWLDGEPVFEQDHLLFRSIHELKIEGVFFSTFFGGGDPSWAPPNDTHADFAAFAVGPERIGCLSERGVPQ